MESDSTSVNPDLKALQQQVRDLEQALQNTQAQLQAAQVVHQKTEQALAVSASQNRSLLQAIPDLIMLISAEGIYVDFFEARDIDLLISNTKDRIGKSVFDILPNDVACQYMAAIQQALATGKTQTFEYALAIHGHPGNYEAKVVASGKTEALLIIRDVTERVQMEEELRQEKERSEKLLLNILPAPIAERLKREQGAIANHFEEATILFADIVGFTQLSAQMPAEAMVSLLNDLFSDFDALVDEYGLEKIKTIGDSYMVVGGIPTPRQDHAEAIANMALDMQDAISQFSERVGQSFQIRIGINIGPVVAGVIGIKKFIYDLWGDAVNVASRMESYGIAGKIQVSDKTYHHLKAKYLFEERDHIDIKGKGQMKTYFLTGRSN